MLGGENAFVVSSRQSSNNQQVAAGVEPVSPNGHARMGPGMRGPSEAHNRDPQTGADHRIGCCGYLGCRSGPWRVSGSLGSCRGRGLQLGQRRVATAGRCQKMCATATRRRFELEHNPRNNRVRAITEQ